MPQSSSSLPSSAYAPDVAPSPGASPDAPRCLHCGAALPGRFCADCGHPAHRGRLTVRGLAHELTQQFLALDRGLWHTVLELARRPGVVIRAYIAGHRRRYVGPMTYLFFASAVLLLAIEVAFGNDLARYQESARQLTTGDHPLLTAAQADAWARIDQRFGSQMTAMTLLMAVPFTIAFRRIFRATGINLAESGVFTLYTFAQTALAYVLLIPALRLAGATHAHRSFATLGCYMVMCAYAAHSFFGPGQRARRRGILAFAAGYLAFLLLFAGTTFAYVVATVR